MFDPQSSLLDAATRTLATVARDYPRLWMGRQHHRPTGKGKLSFFNRLWLVSIYLDNAHYMVIEKAVQIGITEFALCSMFSWAWQGLRGMYIIVSSTHRKTFVSDRIDAPIDKSELYRNAVGRTTGGDDSNVYKQFFDNVGWHFVGSNVPSDFRERPVDVLVYDEFDALNQEHIGLADDRIKASRDPHTLKLGNPTSAGSPIHKEFIESTQNEWHVRCPHCQHEQILDWYTHFVAEVDGFYEARDIDLNPICVECKKPFNRLSSGRWIAMNPGASVSGYRISRLFASANPGEIADLWKRFVKALSNQTAMQVFHNNYLAITHENSDAKITRDVLEQATIVEPADKPPVFDPKIHRTVMGIDQGGTFHVVILMPWHSVYHNVADLKLKSLKECEVEEKNYNVAFTVIDAQGGDTNETRKWVSAKETRRGCYYRAKNKIEDLFLDNPKTHTVAVNRTDILDEVLGALKSGKLKMLRVFATILNGDFLRQMTSVSRYVNAKGQREWGKGNDHFLHATGYSLLAASISGITHSVLSKRNWYGGNETPFAGTSDDVPVDKPKPPRVTPSNPTGYVKQFPTDIMGDVPIPLRDTVKLPEKKKRPWWRKGD